MSNNKQYYLGLDMGTSSVGWAVTDEQYHLLRMKGKDLWGIREFDEADTAVDRRTKRISRRRRQREVARIGLLQDYFADAIAIEDASFFQRLENSKYHLEDKEENVRSKNGVFDDKEYCDADYYKEYPTIYHLRKELLESYNPNKHNVRMLYLALLNMFKHRGHFLNAALGSDEHSSGIEVLYIELNEQLRNLTNVSFPIGLNTQLIEEILSDRERSRTRKKEALAQLLEIDTKNKQAMEFVKALSGLKASVHILFEDYASNEDKKLEVCFNDYNYDEKIVEVEEAIDEAYFHIIELMKQIYDIGIFSGIMKGHEYLSQARVEEYQKHQKDLKVLKNVVHTYAGPEEYDACFRSDEPGSYGAYVNSYNSGKKQRRSMKQRTAEDFYKKVKSMLKNMPQDEEVQYILDEIEKEQFMPKQLTPSNGIIPNQIHLKEMKKILSNAEAHLAFLKEVDDSGLSVTERICRLFSYQIPYYVGPLSKNSKTGWAERKEEGIVYPWNLEQKIDFEKTSEKFITRMVRRCTYMNGEQVLPKSSLLYQSFCVLNEINNIKIHGEPISVELKQDIYRELFEKGKKVTRKGLVSYLKNRGYVTSDADVSGVDIQINSSLSTYGKFKAILGERMETDACKEMVEQIVFWQTVYGDSKKMVRNLLLRQYDKLLKPEEINRICGLRFKDWGNLSKAFLELQGCNRSDGEIQSLIRVMWETNHNLMELINDSQYTFGELLEEMQVCTYKKLSEIRPEDLDEYYFSAPVKRMIWQTLLIMRELEEALGAPPKRLFVEMTRQHQEKKRTESRKKRFLDLYSKIKEEDKDWVSIIENADADGKIRSKKMYLYLTQQGKCMYTGKEIPLNQLFTTDYDIDHIHPRHFVKDDNLENNLVLVDKRSNAHKSDHYPLEESIYQNQKMRWRALRDAGFISETKYNRLICRTEFSDEQKAGFIARQLVETSQGIKGVTTILKQVLDERTEIVYSKGSNVSEFRHMNNLYKSRLINDFHHAQDAYLNIVVGNVYYVKFTKNPLNFIKNEYAKNQVGKEYNLSKMFEWNVSRGDEVAWVAKRNGIKGTIETVKEVMNKNTPMLTRHCFVNQGAISDENIVTAQKAKNEDYLPIKSSDPRMQDVTKYGGLSKPKVAYFFLVEHTVKGKRIRTLESMPVYASKWMEKDTNALYEYCIQVLKLVEPSVRVKKIKIHSLIIKDGFFMYLAGKQAVQCIAQNAVSLCLNREWVNYIKKIEKAVETQQLDQDISIEKNQELYKVLMQKHLETIYVKRPNSQGEKLKDMEPVFQKLDRKEQCIALYRILELTKIAGNEVDMSIMKQAKHYGKIAISKKVSNAESFVLKHQSVTGLYEKTVDLLTI